MEEVFCMACGQKIAATAQFCPHCGAQQAGVAAPAASVAPPAPQSSRPAPAAAAAPLPEGVKGWSWGGFWLNWLWAAFNKVWIGLLALIPLVNLVMMVVLGLKGREWAWQKGGWRDVEHFRQAQKKWDIAAWIVMALSLVLGIAVGFMEARMKSGGFDDRSAPVAEEKSAPAKGGGMNTGDMVILDGAIINIPDLRFSRTELAGALKKAGMDDSERLNILTYLDKPEQFWEECVARDAAFAQMMGSLSPKEAKQHGVESCQGEIAVYHTCLHKTGLDEAVTCLLKNSLEREGE